MRKEINSKSKRKWIMGGLAAFASVALLTTGFALYVVGTTKTDASGNVDVKVDTAENKSIVFDFSLDGADSKIDLKESNVASGKIVTVEQNDTVENALQVKYLASTIKYGTSYVFNFKSIKFRIETSLTAEETSNGYATVVVGADGNKLSGGYARETGTYEYISAPKDIDISSYTAAETGNTKTINIAASTLDFTWGSFFDNKAPSTYYNEKYASENDNGNLTTAADEITSELKAMHDQLDGKKIKLVATLSTEAAA